MKFFDKKDQAPSTPPSSPAFTPAPPPPPSQPAPPVQPPAVKNVEPKAPAPVPQPRVSQTILGESLMIKGDIKAEENITVNGAVEGTIETSKDIVVGPEGLIKASIRAASVVISGKVNGDVTATAKVDLTSTAQLQGNIRSPKLAIAESALFKGSIDMSAPDTPSSTHKEKAESGKK